MQKNFLFHIVGMGLICVACSSQTFPTQTPLLPTPMIQTTRRNNATSVSSNTPKHVEQKETLEPTSSSPPTIEELAIQAFGSRLITHIWIPAIGVYSNIVPVGWKAYQGSQNFLEVEWDSPVGDVGWVITSALPDQPGHILLYGHNNMYKAVFRDLSQLEVGDEIWLWTGEDQWIYVVKEVKKFSILSSEAESYARMLNELQTSKKQGLVLLSCWPYLSNTHRVIVLADPLK